MIEEATLYDLASESGVFVNEKPSVTQVLKTGDQIVIGWYSFRFGIEEATSSASSGAASVLREGRKLFVNPAEDFSPLLLEDEREVREIFDYRPTAKPALEVVMSWSDTILEVEHFVREKTVTIGQSRRSDFGIPPMLSGRQYPIVSRLGRSFVLNIDPQMKGVMQKGGQLQSFEQIRQEKSLAAGAQLQLPIEKDEFAKVTLGEIDFYLSYTAAPPRLKRSATLESDPFFWKVFGTSMVLTALVVTALMSAHVPETLDTEEVPERIATILYQPEKYPEAPKTAETVAQSEPVPVPKVEPKPQPTTKLSITPNPNNAKKPVPKVMSPETGAQTTRPSDQGRAERRRALRASGQGRARARKPRARAARAVSTMRPRHPRIRTSRSGPRRTEARGPEARRARFRISAISRRSRARRARSRTSSARAVRSSASRARG